MPEKSDDKHGVTPAEAEQVFFNQSLLIVEDPRHSVHESRFHALGRTDARRPLHVTFTLRGAATRIRGDLGPRHEPRGEGALCARGPGRSRPLTTKRPSLLFGRATTRPITSTGARPSACACPTSRPSTTSISLRLPVSLLERIKVAAHKRDVPYQSLIKTWLAEKLDAS